MTRFSPSTPKEDVLSHLDPVSKTLILALNIALVETTRVFHSLGRPLKTDRPSDKSYFSHTMRFVAKRALEESGLQARVEEEQECSFYELGQAANTGIVIQLPGIVARVLKSPIDEDLPPAGSESRAEYYEQRQYRIMFPPLDDDAAEVAIVDDESKPENAFHLVYAWDISHDLERLYVKLVCPIDRTGKYAWQHIFSVEEMGSTGSTIPYTPSNPPSPSSLAAAAAAANTDLDLSPKTAATQEEKKEQVKPGVAKRA
jgi:hypothetical protein